MEVNYFSRVLQTCLVEVTSNPALMQDFNCGAKGVPMVDLTKDEVEVCYLPLQGNIAEDLEEDMEMLTPAPGPSTCQLTIHDVSSKAPIPLTDEEQFSPQPLGRLEALMSKGNRTLRLEPRRPPLTLMCLPPKMRPAMMAMYWMQGKMTSK